jgi:hypothetical protein
METERHALFNELFLETLQELVGQHHGLYPRIPPRDIFFEYLVERAFLASGWKREEVTLSPANSPQHDMTVGDTRLSVKSETGKSTKANHIKITKLSTTETGEWTSVALIQHTLSHLDRYHFILMLRAIWRTHVFHYQLLDVPLRILRQLSTLTVIPVGKRRGRTSLGAPLMDEHGRAFRVHFDGADGKCQIHDLRVNLCQMLAEWDHPYTT